MQLLVKSSVQLPWQARVVILLFKTQATKEQPDQ
jgi:hypothetical protein